jgi:type I restriction enzyme S subunit
MHFSDAPDALPVVKIAELKAGITSQTKWTNTDLGARYLIDDGALLFSWSGNPDTSIDTFIWSAGKAWLNQHIFAVRENGRCSVAFLHTMLKILNPEFAELARNKQTTGLGHVTKSDMQRMNICVGSEEIRNAFDEIIGPVFQRIMTCPIWPARVRLATGITCAISPPLPQRPSRAWRKRRMRVTALATSSLRAG